MKNRSPGPGSMRGGPRRPATGPGLPRGQAPRSRCAGRRRQDRAWACICPYTIMYHRRPLGAVEVDVPVGRPDVGQARSSTLPGDRVPRSPRPASDSAPPPPELPRPIHLAESNLVSKCAGGRWRGECLAGAALPELVGAAGTSPACARLGPHRRHVRRGRVTDMGQLPGAAGSGPAMPDRGRAGRHRPACSGRYAYDPAVSAPGTARSRRSPGRRTGRPAKDGMTGQNPRSVTAD